MASSWNEAKCFTFLVKSHFSMWWDFLSSCVFMEAFRLVASSRRNYEKSGGQKELVVSPLSGMSLPNLRTRLTTRVTHRMHSA